MKMKDVLAVVGNDGIVATAIDVTGETDRHVERLERGYLMRINTEKFYVAAGKRKKLPKDGDKW